MSSHFEAIGFRLEGPEDLTALLERLPADLRATPVRGGSLRSWSDASGARLWLRCDRRGALVGVEPDFVCSGLHRVRVEHLISRPDRSPFDGSIHAWVRDPEDESQDLYPLVVDVPDFGAYRDLAIGKSAEIEFSAFAEVLEIFEDEAALLAASPGERKLSGRAVVPLGLFPTESGKPRPPSATAVITGEVVASESRINELSGRPFHHLRMRTHGAELDVLHGGGEPRPAVGSTVRGTFWLSGRPRRFELRRRWWRRWLPE